MKNKPFGAHVAATRRKFQLSRTAFGAMIGVSGISIGRWENHGVVPIGTIRAVLTLLARALENHSTTHIHAMLTTAVPKEGYDPRWDADVARLVTLVRLAR